MGKVNPELKCPTKCKISKSFYASMAYGNHDMKYLQKKIKIQNQR